MLLEPPLTVKLLPGVPLWRCLQMRGPPAKQAFAADGAPTKALEGFCKKNNVTLADITRAADAKGVEYVFANIKDAGRSAAEVGEVAGRLVATGPRLLVNV